MHAVGDYPLDRDALTRHRAIDWVGVGGVLFVGVATFVLCLPFMHAVFWLRDEGALLYGADRMLRGDTLYLDFFEFVPPGAFAIIAGWFALTGVSLSSARLLVALTIAGIACFTFLACRQTSKRALTSVFAMVIVLGWVFVSQGFWTQISHHWFTTLFSMIAAWAALASFNNPQQRRWSLISGMSAGVAAMVVSTRGALVMLAGVTAFLDVRRGRRAAMFLYLLGCLIVPMSLVAYLIARGAFTAAFEDVIVWPASQYASIQWVPFGSMKEPQYDQFRSMVYLYPVVATLTLIACARDWRTILNDGVFRCCVAFSLAGFVGSFPRPDVDHIAFGAPLTFPLLTYCVDRIVCQGHFKSYYAAGALAIAMGILGIGFGIPAVREFYWLADKAFHRQTVTTARGPVAFMSGRPEEPELIERLAALPASDGFFFYSWVPLLPFLTHRKHVSKVDIFTPQYTLPSQYEDACVSAMRDAVWFVIDREMTAENLKSNFPSMTDPNPEEKKRFEAAIEAGFEFVWRNRLFELRRRVKTEVDPIGGTI